MRKTCLRKKCFNNGQKNVYIHIKIGVYNLHDNQLTPFVYLLDYSQKLMKQLMRSKNHLILVHLENVKMVGLIIFKKQIMTLTPKVISDQVVIIIIIISVPLEEIHAELAYADSILMLAMLSFIQDQSFISLIKGMYRFRCGYTAYK